MVKLNCWEFKKCGRELEGPKVVELGVCPAVISGEGNYVNHGMNRGRICWAVAGTFCGGKIQGTFAEKQMTCMSCDFFKKVRDEEGKSLCLLIPGHVYQAPAR